MRDSISISATGAAEAVFTHASFQVTISATAETGPEAKEQARPRIDNVLKVVKDFGEKAAIDTNKLQSRFSVNSYRSHNHNTGLSELRGYSATYELSFNAKNVEEATALHDALTSIKGVDAPSPEFHVEANDTLRQVAFQNAVNSARERFKAQCTALGLDPNNFYIASWSDEGDRPVFRGKSMALEAAASPMSSSEPIALKPGSATYSVRVSLEYARRNG